MENIANKEIAFLYIYYLIVIIIEKNDWIEQTYSLDLY